MLISDNTSNGTLAVQTLGSQAVLSSTCTSTDPTCQWYFDKGSWINVVNPGGGLPGIPASLTFLDSPQNISRLGIGSPYNTQWSMPHVMFSPTQFGTSMAMRAWGSSLSSPPYGTGDAGEQGPVTSYQTSSNAPTTSPLPCFSNNSDCTWTVTVDGMFVIDKSPNGDPLGLNQWGGDVTGSPLVVTGWCAGSNPDCTWKISSSGISSDNGGRYITYSTNNNFDYLSLSSPCVGPYCFLASTNFSMTLAAD